MKTYLRFRFRFLSAFAVVLGATLSLWATTWPGYTTDSSDCYGYGWVTFGCLNEDGTWWTRVAEVIDWQNKNIWCTAVMDGEQGLPDVSVQMTCIAYVHFPYYVCPPDGTPFQYGEESATRSIPNGRDVGFCQDPG